VQFDLTKDPLPGAFNLIVCSEILYYAGDRETLKAVIQKILKSLNPGRYFLTAHAHLVIDEPDRTGFDWNHPFGAKVISDEIASSGLQLRKEIRTPLYRVQLFQLAEHPSTAELLNAPDITILESQPAPLLPQVAAHVHWHGVETRPDFQPRPVTTNRLPILMYHRVAPKGSSRLADYLVTPEGFREQLRYLSEAGYYSLTLDAWCAARELRKPLPGKPVMLTFDDGYADFPDFAWPILKQYGFTCTVFLVSNEIGKTNRWDTFYGDDISLLDWPDILLLQKQGIEFGSHSTTHAHLDGISLPEVVQEAALSRKNLSEKLGKPVHAFTYPYGSTDRVIQHLVGACGYVYGLTVVQRPCTFADSLLALPRIEVSGSDDLQRFIRKLHL
jgi:peptidoglycan/xylan/chitin deacetylase (PgdA/CDA1 family)